MAEGTARRITVLYFAALKELMGCASEELVLPEHVKDVKGLAGLLQALRPPLTGALGGVRFAVGEEFASDTRSLANGDVVALLPPVSGG